MKKLISNVSFQLCAVSIISFAVTGNCIELWEGVINGYGAVMESKKNA